MKEAAGTANRAAGLRPRPSPPLILYGLTVFTAACLVFWVQPLAARGLLPVVGGAPLVWNTAMLFFQSTLLAGYLLAHLLMRRVPRAGQLGVLATLWAVALIVTWSGGIALFGEAAPETGVVLPVLWLLSTLMGTYGPGCLAVSVLSPLVSAWLARDREESDPYVLYAVSNTGSIGILLTYPFVLEPMFGVAWQLHSWTVVFAVLLVPVVLLGLSGRPSACGPEPVTERSAMPWRTACRVLVLSLLPGALLYGVTLRLSTDVAASPFLWVLPLSLYLGTFAVAFGRRQVSSRLRESLPSVLVPAGLILFAVCHGLTDTGLWWLVFHLALFAAVSLWCHGLLWELRPEGSDLTRYYVLIATGGLVGGVLSVLVAPLLFAEVWEYPVLFSLAALLLPGVWSPRPSARKWLQWLFGTGAAVMMVASLHAPSWPLWLRLGGVALLVFSLPGLWTLKSWPPGLAAALLAVSLTPAAAWTLRGGDVIARERTWFGVYRVVEMKDERTEAPGRLRLFFHGTTLHGMEWRREGAVESRTGYYAPEGPYGDLMQGLRRNRGDSLRLGVVGLGAGSLLCYSAPGDRVSVYEIDAAVVSLARRYFTPLAACAPQADVTVGDGRLLLGREAAGSLDALFLDAFSSASIPVHLLTVEALEDYLRVLSEEGLLAIHISNRHLDLQPAVALAAAELGLKGAVTRYEAPPWLLHDGLLPMTTHLVVLARESSVLDGLGLPQGWQPLEQREPTWWRRAWSDDRAGLVPYLR